MARNEKFFLEKQPAAVFKHKLLEDYLAAWAAKLGSRAPEGTAFVDGYAGEGRYGESGSEGSPVIAMRIARARGNLKCVFVEKRQSAARRLSNVILVEGADLDITGPLVGTLEEKLDEVLQAIGQRPALFFLDPFGTALNPDLLVDRIMQRESYSTEVMLNFSLEAVWRMGGCLNVNRADAAAQKTITAANRFLGGDWWHEDFIQARRAAQDHDAYAPAAKAARKVAEGYAQMIQDRAGFQELSVPVRRKPDTEPFFQLMLFHQHDAAKLPFIDAAARAHKRWRLDYWDRYAERVNSPDVLFEMNLRPSFEEEEASIKANAIDHLYRNLKSLVAEVPVARLGPKLERIFGHFIGTASESHLRAAWKKLAQEGVVSPPPRSLTNATISRS
jgi:three-Cys-motif partner protein